LVKFKHSGDIGDILYSLPTARELCYQHMTDELGLIPALFYLDPSGTPPCGNRFGLEAAEALAPLLEAQPWIGEVRVWDGEVVDYDLNNFRKTQSFSWFKTVPLPYLYAEAFNIPKAVCHRKWLEIPDWAQARWAMPEDRQVVFARTARYRDDNFPWLDLIDAFGSDAIFLGLREEYDNFIGEYHNRTDIQWVETRDLLEAATIITSSKLFIGNPSSLFAIAEGTHHPSVLESPQDYTNVIINNRKNCVYIR
jgi:hypothetical protein